MGYNQYRTRSHFTDSNASNEQEHLKHTEWKIMERKLSNWKQLKIIFLKGNIWSFPKTWRENLMTGKVSKDILKELYLLSLLGLKTMTGAGRKSHLVPHVGLSTQLHALDSQ